MTCPATFSIRKNESTAYYQYFSGLPVILTSNECLLLGLYNQLFMFVLLCLEWQICPVGWAIMIYAWLVCGMACHYNKWFEPWTLNLDINTKYEKWTPSWSLHDDFSDNDIWFNLCNSSIMKIHIVPNFKHSQEQNINKLLINYLTTWKSASFLNWNILHLKGLLKGIGTVIYWIYLLNIFINWIGIM